ncbi:hypothetical protein F0562_034963 [Nyssa sinensis]|uniref:Epidermal patterning factor-like protein n=1 Tax=Nyssa sinensis TaxID=561372 RepID=A0A5J5ACQ9_9ASTE|nr:hypothetical protein F0562_034963 [Nyssa sinensis]
MGVSLRRQCHNHHWRLSFAAVSALAFLLFASVSAITLNSTRQLGGTVREERKQAKRVSGSGVFGRVLTQKQKRFGGPGSSPPTCTSKCGQCTPCKPVHLPIPPGLSIPLDYYPEAWRCKCGNKLFMP